MQNDTFTTGARVSLDGQEGYVRETSAPTVNAVLVEFDKPIPGQFTRHAFVRATDLELVEDGEPDYTPQNGLLWPDTIEGVIQLAEALGVEVSALMKALEPFDRRPDRPDYAALEAAQLGDPASEPAGGDL
jgi:hypothetical protein